MPGHGGNCTSLEPLANQIHLAHSFANSQACCTPPRFLIETVTPLLEFRTNPSGKGDDAL